MWVTDVVFGGTSKECYFANLFFSRYLVDFDYFNCNLTQKKISKDAYQGNKILMNVNLSIFVLV